MKLAELVHIGELLDFYGGCLTQNQANITRKYVDYNATLEEIASENGTTRQAVSDVLRRSLAKLEGLEARLNLVHKFHHILDSIHSVANSVANDDVQCGKIAHEFTQLFKTLED